MSSEPLRVTRKAGIRALSERLAPERERWLRRNVYYYAEDHRVLQFLVPPNLAVLEVGCGTGSLLAALRPRRGVGIDFSPAMIEHAKTQHPGLEFVTGDAEDPDTLAALKGPFDVVVLADTFSLLDDCQVFLQKILPLLHAGSRIIIAHHNHLWEPLLRLGELFGAKMPQTGVSWLSLRDIANLLDLAGYDVVQTHRRQLLPRHAFGIGVLLNRYLGTLPIVQGLCVRS